MSRLIPDCQSQMYSFTSVLSKDKISSLQRSQKNHGAIKTDDNGPPSWRKQSNNSHRLHKILREAYAGTILTDKKSSGPSSITSIRWLKLQVLTPKTKPLLNQGRLLDGTWFLTGERKGFGVTG